MLTPDEHALTLHNIDGARSDLHGIAEELEVVKMMLAPLPSRAYVSRPVLMAAASIWAFLGALALLLMR